jgi:hypothetical protein
LPLRRGVICLLAGAAILFSAPPDARGAGIYQDYSRIAYFLIAPAELSVEGRAARVDGTDNEASIYTVTSLMPFRLFLFQLDLPFISVVRNDDIQDGFGDPVFRLRFTAWSGDSEAFYILAGVRAGSMPFLLSDEALFPYSSGTLDLSAGVAFVDTLASVTWWAAGVATFPSRVEDSLSVSGLYDEYTQFTAGVRVPIGAKLGVLAGAALYLPSGHSTRQIYFADLDWYYSRALGFFGYVQVEGGSKDSRAANYSAGVGTKITF